MEQRYAFYVLVDAVSRKQLRGVAISAIELTDKITSVFQLRHAIYAAHPNQLAHAKESDLRVLYNGKDMADDTLLSELDMEETLTVTVPRSRVQPPRHERDARWLENEIAKKRMRLERRKWIDATVVELVRDFNIESWTSTGAVSLNLHLIEPDLPKSIYVRQETLDIIQLYRRYRDTPVKMVLIGTPGMGKSVLLLLFAFQRALREKTRVVLFRAVPHGYSMLYVDAENNEYWRIHRADLDDLKVLFDEDFELFLDGFDREDIDLHGSMLGGFHFLAASTIDYDIDITRLRVERCLVPYWFKSDLSALGTHCLGKTDTEIDDQYFYSGGNVRDFVSSKANVADRIRVAVGCVHSDPETALLSNRSSSQWHVDVLRMRGVDKTVDGDLDQYLKLDGVHVVTSQYALSLLEDKVPADFYKQLWWKADQIHDGAGKELAFQHYVHAVARRDLEMGLAVRRDERDHTYFSARFAPTLRSTGGQDTTERSATMLSFGDDLRFAPVDQIGKFQIQVNSSDTTGGSEETVAAFVQITTSTSTNVDAATLNAYARLFGTGKFRYVVVVPDKLTCDRFHFGQVATGGTPPVDIELFVAYVNDWTARRTLFP